MTVYAPILVQLVFSLALALIVLGLSLTVGTQKVDPEKVSAYECGFDPFGAARQPFDVRFYLVAILFIVFDLEVTFLFPWACVLGDVGMFGFLSMAVFLGILTLGFVYEFRQGALDWE